MAAGSTSFTALLATASPAFANATCAGVATSVMALLAPPPSPPPPAPPPPGISVTVSVPAAAGVPSSVVGLICALLVVVVGVSGLLVGYRYGQRGAGSRVAGKARFFDVQSMGEFPSETHERTRSEFLLQEAASAPTGGDYVTPGVNDEERRHAASAQAPVKAGGEGEI